jgi:probable HAF family extracellular repeat protein
VCGSNPSQGVALVIYVRQRLIAILAALLVLSLALVRFLPPEAVSAGAPEPTSSGPRYVPVYLGPGQAMGLNSRGEVVGRVTSYAPLYEHAFLWAHGVLTDLQPLAGSSFSGAYALNDAGQAVGYSGAAASGHAVLWQNGAVADLGTLGGHASLARGINAAGTIVGCSEFALDSQQRRAFVRAAGGPMRALDPPDGNYNCAYGVNASEQVVGANVAIGSSTSVSHAFLWRSDVITPLLTLGGAQSAAQAINDRGQVVGWSTVVTPSGHDAQASHAALWEGDSVADLGILPGGGHSWAWSINSRGQIVGAATVGPYSGGLTHAVLWQDGEIVDLNTRLVPAAACTLTVARGIADSWDIIADGTCDGVSGAWLLRPEWRGRAFLPLLVRGPR